MLRRLAHKTAVVLANGYILFFFSERVFWSFWRASDSLRDFVITWLVYCLLGWIFLDLVRRFRVASFAPLFLCGAVFGWVGEGVVVDTLYGNKSNFSITPGEAALQLVESGHAASSSRHS
jgi:hypothetical protein